MSENSPKTSAEMEAIARSPNLVEINQEIRDLIIDYAIGAAILGFNPLPGTMTVTLLVASVLLLKMMQDIGAKWGYPKGQDALAIGGNLFGGLGSFWVAFMAWVSMYGLGLFVPFVGGFALASSLFALTWRVGQATHLYYASGRQMDAAELKRVFDSSQAEAEALFKGNIRAIASQQQVPENSIKFLTDDLINGKISQEEFQEKIKDILH
ncbi:MAG: hypothetical protein JGK17_10775 [Microcoleus sp. PH2017_10_PVI_O_A]|uniref:hypothetical protein n=1 Tax=unclassified Microcoleus TaxID=2642155 RepID=UPI001E097AEE|nr:MULTISPECIES: hypothetical protein [unclassified Microcoleus]MCC3406057.1 hypothetical protein [Microcoleus sp. PH2017_10_PVI_O_A]MCC3460196.1 hypothetical protein [Microcoleus sp. PH2017_11_PCY_U_A]MCC3478619.1 hypothetical protein [Microcoleus sp. PH2017_12_PCY_D_A]MCC3529980.1 hypothetical protein [Microcoleus sp. PH2017_21_RUC_O_A]MCC3542321.1 hypothetical protein [Microcoleus sp. PH2017_22_RUC_O_B]